MNERKTLTNYFVDALRLETQGGNLTWYLEAGQGTPAHCKIGERELVIRPSQSTENTDAYTLHSVEISTGEDLLLMGWQGDLQAPSDLRLLYQDIVQSIAECPDKAIAHMQAFVAQSVERQCVFAMLDALKLLQSNLANILHSIQ